MDGNNYSYETFNQAYKSTPAIQNIVDNYNGKEIVLKKSDDQSKQKSKNDDSVEKMAKRATDLSDL